MAKNYITPWCKSGLHHNCPGRAENGRNVALGLDSKGNQTRPPKGPYLYCSCSHCEHFAEERAVATMT